MGETQLQKQKVGADNTDRKKWDKNEFAILAKEREKRMQEIEGETAKQKKNRERKERDPLHMGLIMQRSYLKSRNFNVDLTARLGRTQIISAGAAISEQVSESMKICLLKLEYNLQL